MGVLFHRLCLLMSSCIGNADDGMLVLQALVEGTVLEVHVIINVTNSDPLVELYIPSHYGSGVSITLLLLVTLHSIYSNSVVINSYCM